MLCKIIIVFKRNKKVRGIVTEIKMEYFKKARGTIKCICKQSVEVNNLSIYKCFQVIVLIIVFF